MAIIGEPMRRHHVIPLDLPIPRTAQPNPSSLPATKPETQPSEVPELEPGEIIGWRVWNLYKGLLHSVFVPYIWHPGIFERSNSKRCGYYNHGYHAFRDK